MHPDRVEDGLRVRAAEDVFQLGICVRLAVVEDLQPETKIEILLAAPVGVSGFIIIDVGLMEF